jgi:hypothetical protein
MVLVILCHLQTGTVVKKFKMVHELTLRLKGFLSISDWAAWLLKSGLYITQALEFTAAQPHLYLHLDS